MRHLRSELLPQYVTALGQRKALWKTLGKGKVMAQVRLHGVISKRGMGVCTRYENHLLEELRKQTG